MSERDARGRFVKGSSGNPSGRPVGAEARATRDLRELVREALHAEGGIQYLRWASRHHATAFLALLGRLIPAEIRAKLEGDAVPLVVIRDFTGISAVRPRENGATVEIEDVGLLSPTIDVKPEASGSQSPSGASCSPDEPQKFEVLLSSPPEPSQRTHGTIQRPPETEREAERWEDDDEPGSEHIEVEI